ncbi:MAG: undecaprenyl-diphosphate phosphatase [Rickettsiales bacterium]|nr:undecaprenyl-diphosphate phosphatase [Rickettsiales bacterium]
MPYEYLLVLSLVQGIAEFLPISSSAHLILLPQVAGVADQGLFVDVAAHVGSLFAVLLFYRARVWEMLCWRDRPLMSKLVISFIPIVIFGVAKLLIGFDTPRSAVVAAWASIIFGILLWLCDRRAGGRSEVSRGEAALAGCAQALAAAAPGVSRSGIVLSSLRARGVARPAAVDFAFLMSIPAIAAAGAEALLEAHKAGEAIDWARTGFVVGTSFVFSLGAIRLMRGWVSRFSFGAFAIYRVVLGIAILLLL